MAVIKKTLFAKNLDNYSVLVNDTDVNSKYFKITNLPDTFTGGKNAFLIAGSQYLVPDTKIQIELKDASGNIIYHEPGEGLISSSFNGESFVSEYFEGVSKVVSVYVYPDTSYGPCTLTILGELNVYETDGGITSIVPLDWENKYNVKWQRQINVDPSLANTTKIRFYQRPQATITEILNPIYTIVSGSKVASAVTQSFADIKLSKLETFAGDVKRIKVFRTSEGDISDYDLIQDILVESKELLTSYGLTGSVVGNTGTFTSETIKNYWNSGSLNAVLNSERIAAGVRLTGSGNFTYTSSLDIKSTNTYELNLDAFYSSSTASNLGIYLISGSASSSIGTLYGISPTKNLSDTVIPFKTDKDYISASLYFSQSQGDWHLGNISLKLSQDTAFSPDEISFVTTMPTAINNQTYNFKFEFYDVNNNYVPVAVTQSATFTGGNAGATAKLLTFQTDRSAFRFSTGSYGNPANQTVKFSTQKTNLTGSLTYASSAFDIGGNYITPASYAGTYPGTLTNVSDNGALLTIANFSGSVASVLVGSIVYTASCENFIEYETIYRFEDGDNAPGVFVTANTNQFIYKATDLSLNPSGQVITIEAKRKNLASAVTPLTINSGSGKPGLTFVSTNSTNGVDTYTISGTSYPYSTGETIYSISGSDQFGNVFSDAIKISPVKILDGLSVSLTNDNASLPARSNGFIESGSFVLSSGSVSVKVGNETITHSNNLLISNSFDVISAIATNVQTGSLNYSTTNYHITRLDADSGSLNLTIRYKDGYGDITDVSKLVTYSKNKKASPVLSFVIGNNNQTVTAKSTGNQIDAFVTASLSVIETYDGISSTKTLTGAPTTTTTNSYTIGNKTTTTIALPTIADATDSVDISVTGSVVDSENITRNVYGSISLAKTKKAAPVLAISSTPKDQSVTAKSTGAQIDSFANATIVVKQTYNGSDTTLPATLTATRVDTGGSLTVNNTTGVVTLSNQTLATGTNSTTINISAVVTDSEGTSRTLTDTLSLSKVKKAVPNVEVSVSPQAQSVTANADGSSPSTPTSLTVKALEGGTTRLTTVTATGTNVTAGTVVYDPVSGTPKNYATIPLSAVAADNASVAITINYTDSEGTDGTKTLTATISKAKKGTNGDNGLPGDAGADGKRTATGLLYYQLAAGTAPATPTATSYTFSTNTFAGLTANWALGAPTFAAGNSNKYWYSTYTAVETTAGGNTAVPTFTTVTQAIGFTGLVTFTSANNLTDGTLTSEIIPKGSITNHIGGANVTTIDGGKISTGVITSTGYTLLGADTVASGSYMGAGTIFNLDNGSLRSKNFYITSAGNAFFKGDITGASGTFSGTLSGATITGGTINIGPNKFKVDSSGNSTIGGNLDLNAGGTVSIRGYKYYNGGSCTSPSVFLDPGGDFVFRDFDTNATSAQIIGFMRGYTTITNCGSPFETISKTIVQTSVDGFTWGSYGSSTAWATLNGTELNVTGDVVANTSDKRLKTNIVNIDSPLEKLNKINGVYFNWNETAKELNQKDTNKREVGFIAQEVQSVLPEIVSLAPFDTIEHTNQSKSGENYLTIQYEKMVPLLVECIKELKKEIEELKNNK